VARAELARWTGDDAPTAIGEPPSWSIDEPDLRAGLANLPEVSVIEAMIDESEAEVRVA